MDFLLCGDDSRMHYLARLLLNARKSVSSWHGPTGGRITTVESPLELHSPVRLVLPFGAERALVQTALDTLPVGSLIFGGAFSADEEQRLSLLRRAHTWVNLLEDDEFCKKNAVPTAEGALHCLLERTPKVLSELCVALTGSGRVSTAVASLLDQNGVEVCILARNPKKRKALRAAGFCTLPLPVSPTKLGALGRVDALINTVEARGIVSEELLGALPRGTPILELASGRDNVDLSAAQKHAHPVCFLPALPGKIAPQTAAEALFCAITKKRDVTL